MLPAPRPLDYVEHADPSDRFRQSRSRSGGRRVRGPYGRETRPAA